MPGPFKSLKECTNTVEIINHFDIKKMSGYPSILDSSSSAFSLYFASPVHGAILPSSSLDFYMSGRHDKRGTRYTHEYINPHNFIFNKTIK